MGEQEWGGIVTGWLMQLVVFMSVIAFVGYEAITIAITAINLEDDAREVARAAAQAYGSQRTMTDATEAAEQEAAVREVELESVTEEDGQVTVEVSQQASTLVVHRIGALEDLTMPTSTGAARWRP